MISFLSEYTTSHIQILSHKQYNHWKVLSAKNTVEYFLEDIFIICERWLTLFPQYYFSCQKILK